MFSDSTVKFLSAHPDKFDAIKSIFAKHQASLVGWTVQLSMAKRRRGQCNYTKRVISLSKDLIRFDTLANVRNTLLHEIAHVMTPGHKHDAVWKSTALQIGCNGERCGSAITDAPSKYVFTCTDGCCIKYHRMPKRTMGKICKLHRKRLAFSETASTDVVE